MVCVIVNDSWKFRRTNNHIFLLLENSFLIENSLEMQKTSVYCRIGCMLFGLNESKLIQFATFDCNIVDVDVVFL